MNIGSAPVHSGETPILTNRGTVTILTGQGNGVCL